MVLFVNNPPMLPKDELKEFLDYKVSIYNKAEFIESDPIQVPHRYSKKEDIEISAFLTASIAWGNRKNIINNAKKMMLLMGDSPHDFVMNFTERQNKSLSGFAHRTFSEADLNYFIKALKYIYNNHNGMEYIFNKYQRDSRLQYAIHRFRAYFFELGHLQRTEKHIADPMKNSAAKRINLFLRWMIRKDKKGVDFGLWKSISPSVLSCPLDLHSAGVARKLGILTRQQNDAKAVLELDGYLRNLDPKDPVRYDYALFGLGVFEKF